MLDSGGMTPGEKLFEELEVLQGMSETEVVETIDDCWARAKTKLARQRLDALEDSYLTLVDRRYS